MPGQLLDPTRLWQCPSCGHRHKTTEPRPHTPLHPCSAHGGLSMPLAPADRHGLTGRVHHRVIERGDYIGSERVAHGGVMAVHSERPDGSHDTHVFAATATVETETGVN